MSIITGDHKKATLKVPGWKYYPTKFCQILTWPARVIIALVVKSKRSVCPKCKTIILSFYPCPTCGYKTLNRREIKLNFNESTFSYQLHDKKPRVYESKEIDSTLAYVSDIGERHHENQDSGTVEQIGDWKFLGVSDGVSRSNSPKMASSFAVKYSQEYLAEVNLTTENALFEIKKSILYAHDKIKAIQLPTFNPDYDPPEATIVIALVKDGFAYIGWVGDSRAYIMDKGHSQILTRDDSWVMVAVENGMSFQEANESPMAHAITQCMGMHELPIVPHAIMVDISNKDLLLCSDGLWNYFDDEVLMHELYLHSPGSAKETGTKLVRAANHEGGRDNITVAILKSE